jgi:preprotein translocase subunit YajC
MLTLLQAAPAAKGFDPSFILMMVAIFVVMWLFMIRPQQKRQKELLNFRKSLESGMKVITAGGIYGTVKEVHDTYVLIEVDKNVDIRVDKSMVMKDSSSLQQR